MAGNDPGRLVLVVGPSGVGKDSLISAARDRLGDAWLLPQRYITRPAAAGGEEHIEVDEDTFQELVARGAFAVHWQAHGLSYGIPVAVADALAAGRHVLLNVSRAAIGEFEHLFSRVRVVAVTADPAVIASRLHDRARESATEIAARLVRDVPVRARDLREVDNSSDLETGIARFLAALEDEAEP